MVPRTLSFSVLLLLSLFFSCAPDARAAPDKPSGKRVTRVLIKKGDHTLNLFARDELVASYHAAIGPGWTGPKRREGDRVTPVGRYHITMHQPSQFKIFLRLDYPNADDRARFDRLKKSGELPKEATIGGDIGIHGPPVSLPDLVKDALNVTDWTLGCIAVDDGEIREIARRVPDGTIVDIED